MPDVKFHNFDNLIEQSSEIKSNNFLNKNYSGLINIALKENNIYLINALFESLPPLAFTQTYLTILIYKLNINRINILVKYEAKIEILDEFMKIIRAENLLTKDMEVVSAEYLNKLNEKLQLTAKKIYKQYREKLQDQIFKFTENAALKIYYHSEFRNKKEIEYIENAGKPLKKNEDIDKSLVIEQKNTEESKIGIIKATYLEFKREFKKKILLSLGINIESTDLNSRKKTLLDLGAKNIESVDLNSTREMLESVGIDVGVGSNEKRYQLTLKKDSITKWIPQTNAIQFLTLDLDEYFALYDNFVKKEFGVMFELNCSTFNTWDKTQKWFKFMTIPSHYESIRDGIKQRSKANQDFCRHLLEQFTQDKLQLTKAKHIVGQENYTAEEEIGNYYLKEKRLIDEIYSVKIGNYEFDLNNAILNQIFKESNRTPQIAVMYNNADGKSEEQVTADLKAFLKNLKFYKQSDLVNIMNIILQDFYKKAIILHYEINAKVALIEDSKNKKINLERIQKLNGEKSLKENELELVEKIIFSLSLRGANIKYPNISNDVMDIIYETERNGKKEKIEILEVKIANEIEKIDKFKLIFQRLAQKESRELYEYILADSYFLTKYNKFDFTEADIVNFIPQDAEKALHKVFNKIKELEETRKEYSAKKIKQFSITYSWKKFFRWLTPDTQSLDNSLENLPAEIAEFKKDFFNYYLEDAAEDLLNNYHISTKIKESNVITRLFSREPRALISELEIVLEEFYKEMKIAKQAEEKINDEIKKAQSIVQNTQSEDSKTKAQNVLIKHNKALNAKKLELIKKYGQRNKIKTIEQYNLSIVSRVIEYCKMLDHPDTKLQAAKDKAEDETVSVKLDLVKEKLKTDMAKQEAKKATQKADAATQKADAVTQALFRTFKKIYLGKTDQEIMIMVEEELNSIANENKNETSSLETTPSTSTNLERVDDCVTSKTKLIFHSDHFFSNESFNSTKTSPPANLNHSSSTESLTNKQNSQTKNESSLRYMRP